MTETDELPKTNIFTRMEAAAFNMQLASYEGHRNEYVFAHEEYTMQVKAANKLGVDSSKMDLAETKGRLKAAIESGNENDKQFFEKQLEEMKQ